MDIKQILAQLQHRGVTRVATVYAAAAWALLQVADVLFPIVGLGDKAITLVLLLACAGFPLSIALAWVFDLTSGGLVETAPETLNTERFHLTPLRIAAVVASLALILLVGYLYLERLRADSASLFEAMSGTGGEVNAGIPEPGDGRVTIAVLPFVNFSDASDMGYFGDGLAEEILNLLAKLGELNVSARSSSFYFKDKRVDIPTIARQLGVQNILEGSVRHDGKRVRVTVQLIQAQNGFHLWSESYDRDLEDILNLQLEIATEVVKNLQVVLSNESRDLLQREQTIDPDAYDYYLRGRDYLRQPRVEQTLHNAEQMFRKAVKLAPDSADALAGLCDTLLFQYSANKEKSNFIAAEQACLQAQSLESHSPAVHVALGNLYRDSGQYALAEREFNRALSLNATAVDAYVGLAETFVSREKYPLAEQTLVRAIELQPKNWATLMAMGRYLFNVGRVDESISYFQRVDDLLPESRVASNNLGAAYYLMGRFGEAAAAWEDALGGTPNTNVYLNLGSSYFFLGRFDDAAQMYQQALELAPEHFEVWGNLGDAYRHSASRSELASAAYHRAIELAEQHLQINSADAVAIAALAHYQAAVGERASALENIDLASELAQKDMFVYYFSATALCALNEPEQALDSIRKALSLGYPPHMVRADIGLSRLRTLPDYEAVLTQQGHESKRESEGETP
ncbi:MAG: tetratricopeptide repeat protein [Halieaceae bacterium]|jgi:TolB-like protein/Flp pilus assembly protein TadD|nr:tetratricopeptide repeat protein [Halieaceae bacterium]